MFASNDSNLDDFVPGTGGRRLYYQRLEQKSILMYKILHVMTPDYLRSGVVYRDDVSACRLRNAENKFSTVEQPWVINRRPRLTSLILWDVKA